VKKGRDRSLKLRKKNDHVKMDKGNSEKKKKKCDDPAPGNDEVQFRFESGWSRGEGGTQKKKGGAMGGGSER